METEDERARLENDAATKRLRLVMRQQRMKEEIWNELYLYLRIEIGVFKNFKECARSPCNGNHFSS